MADYYAFQGDTKALISDALASDVTGYTGVTFIAKKQGSSKTISRAGTVDVAASGTVSVELTAADLSQSGDYDCAWQFDDGSSGTWTLPADTVKILQIRKALT